MILTIMKSSGGFLSAKRNQINKINYYAEKINKYNQLDPEKALVHVNKLIAYRQKLQGEKHLSTTVQQWFIENDVDHVKKRIELSIRVRELSATTKLGSIYEQYNGKDSFRALIEEKLLEADEQLTVHALESGNNPIVKVVSGEQCFIIRFLRMNKNEESSNKSPRVIRELYSDMIPQIPHPYFLEKVEDDGHEITYMEYSEFYPEGNLQTLFEQLRDQKEKEIITDEEFNKTLLLYAKKLATFFTLINEQHIWYTDLKPSNILLNEHDIIISDIKGLIQSHQTIVASNKTNTSQFYYQSTVYNDNNIHLELLQCQTLATTLYELACGRLPKQKISDKGTWKNIYDFAQPVFSEEHGAFLEELIKRLNIRLPTTMTHILAQIDDHLLSYEEEHHELLIDDSDIIELPTPRKPRGYSKL
ncbi:protein kinase family protein [Legionella fallonii]|uniref:Serine/threonine-protein kinase n=1 Tax=Legionella fallonii LLAP-10 TaxID=1212491 RepID=A0A098G506_9GAMM|nr:serine/threonine-protein kinase [Legionella fallonii]CEG57074.1 Serine/threonine-protein kinase [Legionella fallonii LLAP-10]